MKICGIYGIVNTANGKWYVGQSVDLKRRIDAHLNNLKLGRHYNGHLQAAFIKYRADSFEWHIIEETNEEVLDARECAWITHYKSNQERFGYNLNTGGKLNKHHSEATRRKIGLALKGRPSPKRGIPCLEETKRKSSETQKGIPRWPAGRSLAARRKMSKSQKMLLQSAGQRKARASRFLPSLEKVAS